MFDVIAFDADDTLWHNEGLFNVTQEKFRRLLEPYHEHEWINAKLLETERRNLALFGYGIKGFALSMIETAIELTEGRIGGAEIANIMDAAKEMLRAPVETLPGVNRVLKNLGEVYPLMVITKGDLFDQEAKLARSGLGDFFRSVDVVSEKDESVYRAILERHQIDPCRFLMVGNSLKSDILPIIALGGAAVHIPYHTLWVHERVEPDPDQVDAYHELEAIEQLPDLIKHLTEAADGS